MKNNIIVDCKKNSEFEEHNKLPYSCNRLFLLDKSDVFYLETPGYFDDIISDYYAICPYCGYFVLLDKKVLPEEWKEKARENYKIDDYQYQKNLLISQLIHLEGRSRNNGRKVRVRCFEEDNR